ncbi:MAG: hypothetical protein MJ237_07040 [bacterium]|nr:hypothetical protein [bacterium]
MGKAKKRSLNQNINDKFQYMTRESALNLIVKNIDDRKKIIDTVTLFGFTAEEMLEAGVEYEDVMALGGLIN